MELKKIVKKEKKTNSQGKEYTPINYWLIFDNEKKVLIKPVFKDDYAILNFVATLEIEK